MKFRGGGATRKTGSCCDLTISHSSAKDNLSPKPLKNTCLEEFYEKMICHSGLDPESINADKDRLRLGGRSDECGQITNSSFRHSEFLSESLNKATDSGSEAGMTKISSNNLCPAVRNDKSGCKAAFTMAEVLITLGIIGIVAAMTLPSLINKAERMILTQQFKKSYANLQNAVNSVQWEHGMPYVCYVMGASKYYDTECSIFWPELLSKLRVIRICNYDDEGCSPGYKTKEEILSAGGNVDNLSCSLTANLDKYYKVYTLYDGSYLLINPGSPGNSAYSQWVVIDVNGEKGPNKWGYDVFWTNLYRENEKKNVVMFDEICKMKEKGGVYFRDMILK